jgi:hypothetical protein
LALDSWLWTLGDGQRGVPDQFLDVVYDRTDKTGRKFSALFSRRRACSAGHAITVHVSIIYFILLRASDWDYCKTKKKIVMVDARLWVVIGGHGKGQ